MKALTITLATAFIGSLGAAQTFVDEQRERAWMVVQHEVADFDHWKKIYDGALSTRQSVGELSSHVLRNETNPNLLTVVMEWENVHLAAEFAGDPVLENGMRAAGVQLPATILICESESVPTSDTCVARQLAFAQ